MDIKEIMKIIKETFDDELYADLDDFCGDPFATIKGRSEFFKKIELKLGKNLRQ